MGIHMYVKVGGTNFCIGGYSCLPAYTGEYGGR